MGGGGYLLERTSNCTLTTSIRFRSFIAQNASYWLISCHYCQICVLTQYILSQYTVKYASVQPPTPHSIHISCPENWQLQLQVWSGIASGYGGVFLRAAVLLPQLRVAPWMWTISFKAYETQNSEYDSISMTLSNPSFLVSMPLNIFIVISHRKVGIKKRYWIQLLNSHLTVDYVINHFVFP